MVFIRNLKQTMLVLILALLLLNFHLSQYFDTKLAPTNNEKTVNLLNFKFFFSFFIKLKILEYIFTVFEILVF